MRELFIYYRSPVHHAERVQQLVNEFQTRLQAQRPQLSARLLRRPQPQSERITWMEIYSIGDPALHPLGVDDALRHEIEAAAQVLNGCIDGERHTEVFEPCA